MKLSGLTSLAAPLILAGAAEAGFIGIVAVHKPNPFALTYNIYAQFDARPGDFILAVQGTAIAPLNISVIDGTFYQNVFGGNKAPSAALFAVFPSLEFDTFVTIGKKTSQGDATQLAPGFPGFGPSSLAMDDSGWFITEGNSQGTPNANGQVLLCQLSTQNGVGFTGDMLIGGFSNGVPFQEQMCFNTVG